MLGFVLMGQVALAQNQPFKIERYTSPGDLNTLTTYSTAEYYAAIISFQALQGDIFESTIADIIKVYPEADPTGFWRIHGEFISHIQNEGWNVEVMFIDKDFADGNVVKGDGATTKIGGSFVRLDGHDFILGQNDGREQGVNNGQRALVHSVAGDTLIMNYVNDFEGGVKINSNLTVSGTTTFKNNVFANGNNIAQVRKYSSANPAIPAEFTSMGKSGSNNAIKKNYYGFSARTDTAALNMAVNGNEAVIDYAAHEFGIYSSANGQNPTLRLEIDNSGDVRIPGKLFVNGNEVTGASGARVAQDPEAMAQMMQELEDLRQQNQALEARLAAIEKSMLGQQPTDALQIPAARLAQNYPNPFTQRTTINYELPANTQQATLYVFDMSGQQKMVFNNLSAGKGQTTINANTLQPGMYIYSLVVNGKVLDTKRMLLTK